MLKKKPTHVIVKARHPRVRQGLYILLLSALLAGSWALFEYGRYRAGFDAQAARKSQSALQERIGELESENKRLSAQNVALEQAREIDRRAYSEVDANLAGLQDELLELKREVEFYRGIVSTADAVKGLQIQSVRLEKDKESPSYRYRLILMQAAVPGGVVQGEVKLAVSGLNGEMEVELSHQDLFSAGNSGMPFRFRHFQELAGNLRLPDGFTPLRMTLTVTPRDKARQPVERTYSWPELFS